MDSKQKDKFILDNKSYSDISLFAILKFLYRTQEYHSDSYGYVYHIGIAKYDYKDSIKRLMSGKSLSEKVNRKIQFYLHNIKSRSSQNTLIAITKKANSQDKRFITVTHKNNQCYAVHLKKEKFIQYTQNTHLCPEYKEIMLTKIKSEFESKIRHDNAIVGGVKE